MDKFFINPLFFFIFFGFPCLANLDPTQGSDKNYQKYFDTSIGASYFYLKDRASSPVIYAGTNLYSDTRVSFNDKKTRHGINIRFNYGKLTPKRKPEQVGNSSELENMRVEIDHYYLRKVYNLYDDQVRFYVGSSINLAGNMRNHSKFTNNSFSYDQTNSLNLNVQTEYSFNMLKRNFTVKYRSFLPIYTFIVRPSFASSTPLGFINQESGDFKAYIKSGQHTSLNRFFRWVNSFDLEYDLKNNNKIRITYLWDYYSFKSDYGVQSANHSILIGTMFNF